MSDLVDRLGCALLDASFAAFAISGFVILAIIQNRQPARRIGWARAGLLSTLAILPLAAVHPTSRLDVHQIVRSTLASGSEYPTIALSPRETDRNVSSGLVSIPDHSNQNLLRQVGRGIVLVYLGILFLGLGRLGLGAWGSNRLVEQAVHPCETTKEVYASLEFRSGESKPRLLIADRVTRPVLIGFFRPTILIPPFLDQAEVEEKLRLSLLHELAHAGSADHRHGLAAHLARSIWFYLPPVWWIHDQMRLDQEYLADRRAAQKYGTSGRYASSLVDLAASRTLSAAVDSSKETPPSSLPARSTLFQRVFMLLKCPFVVETIPPLWWRWWASLTMGMVTLAASSLTVQSLTEPSTPSPSILTKNRQTFRLPQLLIRQMDEDEPPFDLRFRLPDRFQLTLEVMADLSEQRKLEILGHRIELLGPTDSGPATNRTWHRVQLIRDREGENLEVDGIPVANLSRPSRLSTWFTIRPIPGQSTRIRDLVLSW